jgi:hypothetical protein
MSCTLRTVIAIAALNLAGAVAHAEGNLATKCEELPKLVFGTDPTGFKVSPEKYDLVTGKCYELQISSSGNKEYAIRGETFFRNIWLRKIEAGGMEIKAHSLYELEYEKVGEAEIFFVQITPGTFILAAEGLEDKGTKATFTIK